MPVYFNYGHYCGGLGDFLRSALAFFSFCKHNGVEFYLNITDHPVGKYFKNNINNPVLHHHSQSLFDIDQNSPQVGQSLQYIVDHKDHNVIIMSNIYTFIDLEIMKKYAAKFLELIEVTSEINDRVNQLCQTCSLLRDGSSNYESFHLRCGDLHMLHTDYKQDDSDFSNRIGGVDIHNKLSTLFKDNPSKILFHCDNEMIKREIASKYGFAVLDVSIYHIAHKANDEQYIDVLAEFLIMGRASKIYHYAPKWVSGYSKWSAFIHGKEYEIIN